MSAHSNIPRTYSAVLRVWLGKAQDFSVGCFNLWFNTQNRKGKVSTAGWTAVETMPSLKQSLFQCLWENADALKGLWENTWLHHHCTGSHQEWWEWEWITTSSQILLVQYYHHKVMEKSCFINRLSSWWQNSCVNSEQSKLLFLLSSPPSIRFLRHSVAGGPVNFRLTNSNSDCKAKCVLNKGSIRKVKIFFFFNGTFELYEQYAILNK